MRLTRLFATLAATTAAGLAAAACAQQAPVAAPAPAPADAAPASDPLLLPGDETPPGLERMLRAPRPQPPGGQPPAPADTTLAPSLALSMRLGQAIVNACLAQNIRVGVGITDIKGNLRFGMNADGAVPGRIFVAARKASAVVVFGESTAAIKVRLRANVEERAKVRPYMALYTGGEPLYQDGVLIGAVAASGGTGDQDDSCVLAGLAKIPGLSATPPVPR
ncbi:heme-binding protein [Novosphingobium flavum]|uniref:Heme-binding protein n=1 Tax=Novosphingobium flavum TaxID=1778672 RepID=A0A7X1FW46_9SPHN|nr:heme-binding protein [Novosphingobium flavum]MBC2667477.1 heme-binding protein [Novosphingobium flavum]